MPTFDPLRLFIERHIIHNYSINRIRNGFFSSRFDENAPHWAIALDEISQFQSVMCKTCGDYEAVFLASGSVAEKARCTCQNDLT